MTSRVLLTGASGFVGSRVRVALRRAHVEFRCIARRRGAPISGYAGADGPFVVDRFDGDTDYGRALDGVSTVIHCAGRAHLPDEDPLHALEAHRRVNRDGTASLAQAAKVAGVGRFVYVSTIGVSGRETTGRPFTAADVDPRGAYAISKYEAERALLNLAAGAMSAIVVRPPLVYGANPPGNLGRIVSALKRRRPIPLGLVASNRRSLLGVDNLAAALLHAAIAPTSATGRSYTIADEGVVSTRRIVRLLAEGLGVTPVLVPVPVGVLRLGGSAVGRRVTVEKLVSDLEVDSTDFIRATGWQPINTLEDGLRAAGAGSRGQ